MVSFDPRPELAEAIGVFALVFAGCGAIMTNALTGALGHVGVALTFAFVITVMIFALGHVSGAHFNPAITLAFAATGHFPWRRVPGYIAAQVGAAVAAALALRSLLGDVSDLGTTTLAGSVAFWPGFILEALTTFFLALVIVSVATDARASGHVAGLAIGLTVGLDALFAGPLTGASMNPARSLGPALVSGATGDLVIYLTAPVVGAVLAMGTYTYLRQGETPRRNPGTADGSAAGPSNSEGTV